LIHALQFKIGNTERHLQMFRRFLVFMCRNTVNFSNFKKIALASVFIIYYQYYARVTQEI